MNLLNSLRRSTGRLTKPDPGIFETVTRSLIEFDTEMSVLHEDMISLSKARRGSVKIGERMFLDIFRAIGGRHIIEAGGNDGRHTRHFLSSTSASIHVFEPNIFACPLFEEIFSNEKLFLNGYGLSDTTRVLPLSLPRSFLGRDLGRVSGIASVEGRNWVSSAETHVVAVARADAYFENQPQIAEGPVGLWLDVEGHADAALAGFGRHLAERIDVVLVEVEYEDLYERGGNAGTVIAQLHAAGMHICYRDFMNTGQCNLLAVSDRALNTVDKSNEDALRFYGEITDRYAAPEASGDVPTPST